MEDALGPLRAARAQPEEHCDAAQANQDAPSTTTSATTASSAGPASEVGSQFSEQNPGGAVLRFRHPTAELDDHEWRLTAANKWVCGKCLCTSRVTPPQAVKRCRRFSPVLAELLDKSRGHKLQMAMLTSGAGCMVLCTKSGHHCSGNRRTGLHNADCPGAERSIGAKNHITRFYDGYHPSHKVQAKELERAFPLDSLRGMAKPTSSQGSGST